MDIFFSVMKVLQINEMLIIYLIVFSVMFLFVSKFLIQPYYDKFLERQETTLGLIEQAEEVRKQNIEKVKKYEKQLYEFNISFDEPLKVKKDDILKTHKKLIEETHSQAKLLISTAKKKLTNQYQIAEKELDKQAFELAQKLSTKFLK